MHHSRLLQLLLRRVLMAPVDSGGTGGGAAAEEVDDDLDDEPGETDEAGDEGDGGDATTQGAGSDEDGPVVVSLGEELDEEADEESIATALADQPTNAAFAKLRKSRTDLKRQTADQAARIRELEGQLAATQPADADIDVGAEPDLDDYETYTAEGKAKFKADHAAWVQRRAEAETQKSQRAEKQQAAQRAWQTRVAAVNDAGKALKAADHDTVVSQLEKTFSVPQMGMLVDVSDDPRTAAALRYAIASRPELARKLAAIESPVKFIAAVTRLETKMSISSTRKAAPPAPDRQVRAGSAAGAVAVDNQLERLRETARKTGDYTKVAEFQRQQREKAKKAA